MAAFICITTINTALKAQIGVTEPIPPPNLGGINPDGNCGHCSNDVNDGSHPSQDRRWRFRPDMGNLVHLCEGNSNQTAYRFGFNINVRNQNRPYYRYTFQTFYNSEPGSDNTEESLAILSDATYNSQCIGAVIQPYYNATQSTYIGNNVGGLSLMLGNNYKPNIFIHGSTNHVGIGTTEPEHELDVAGTSSAYRFRATPAYGGEEGSIELGRIDKSWRLRQLNASEGGTDDLSITSYDATSGQPYSPPMLTIKRSGRVGIGTSEPQSVLEVANTSQAGLVSTFKAGNTTNYMEFMHYGGGAPNYNDLKFNVKPGSGLAETNFKLNGARFLTTNMAGITKLGTGNQLVCAPNGNVGIGMDNPSEQLEVSGIARVHRLRAMHTGTDANDGYVDIGRPNKYWSIKQRNATGGGTDDLRIQNYDATASPQWGPVALSIHRDGRVGVGTENPNASAKLHVKGSIAIEDISASDKAVLNIGLMKPNPQAQHADARLLCAGKGVFTSLFVYNENNWVTWPDFVFESNYSLPKLSDIENFLKREKHLPGVPTAKEVNEKGIDLLEMNKILLQKIEEMTLHLIRLEKEVEELKTSK